MTRAQFSAPELVYFDVISTGADISDLEIVPTNEGLYLYAVSQNGSLLSSFSLSTQTLGATFMSSVALPQYTQGLSSAAIVPRSFADDIQLLLPGLPSDPLQGFSISIDGNIGASHELLTPDTDASLFTSFSLSSDGSTGLAGLQSGALVQVALENGLLTSTEVISALDNARAPVNDLTTLDVAQTTFAFAIQHDTDRILVLEHSSGQFELRNTLTAGNGVWFDQPTALTTVNIRGQDFVLVGSTGSNSLTLFEFDPNTSSLTPVDHVLDSLNTRFSQPSHLESFTSGGRAFVVAAGHDNGLSVLEVLPNGQLHPVTTLEGSETSPLAGINTIEVLETNSGARIFVSTETTPFLVEYSFDFENIGGSFSASHTEETLIGGAQDDVLHGQNGSDTLFGEEGADVLIDGAGTDTLWGGSGADTFVFTMDGSLDRIMDFEIVIDFSSLSTVFSPANIGVSFQAYGADIFFNGETLELHLSEGSSVTLEDLQTRVFCDIDRVNIEPTHSPPPPIGISMPVMPSVVDVPMVVWEPNFPSISQLNPDAQYGNYSNAADIVILDQGPDTLSTLAGDDLISTGGGNDWVDAGDGNDLVLGGLGFDHLYGGSGDDRLDGGTHADLIHGGDGDDIILGRDGFDNLHGNAGNDSIWGGSSPDRLSGGAGNDLLRGGRNFGSSVDGLSGGDGDDWLFGEAGFDTLDGGQGDDMMFGGDQADNLHGQAGNDVLDGGNGFDRLFAGDGDDILFGGQGTDALFGQRGNDLMSGGTERDRLWGGSGNDGLWGGNGNDELQGGAGFDWIIGGEGNDMLAGNFNADVFVFEDGHGHDVIRDFEANNDLERIDFSNLNLLSNFNSTLANTCQDGANSVIETGSDSSITLLGVNIGDLDSADFIF